MSESTGPSLKRQVFRACLAGAIIIVFVAMASYATVVTLLLQDEWQSDHRWEELQRETRKDRTLLRGYEALHAGNPCGALESFARAIRGGASPEEAAAALGLLVLAGQSNPDWMDEISECGLDISLTTSLIELSLTPLVKGYQAGELEVDWGLVRDLVLVVRPARPPRPGYQPDVLLLRVLDIMAEHHPDEVLESHRSVITGDRSGTDTGALALYYVLAERPDRLRELRFIALDTPRPDADLGLRMALSGEFSYADRHSTPEEHQALFMDQLESGVSPELIDTILKAQMDHGSVTGELMRSYREFRQNPGIR